VILSKIFVVHFPVLKWTTRSPDQSQGHGTRMKPKPSHLNYADSYITPKNIAITHQARAYGV